MSVSPEHWEQMQERTRERERWLAGDEARTERGRSRSAFRSLTAEQARGALRQAHRGLFEPTAPVGGWLRPGDRVVEELGDAAALVDRGAAARALVESTLPLAVRGGDGAWPGGPVAAPAG